MKHILLLFFLLGNTTLNATAYKLKHPNFDLGMFSIFSIILGILDYYEKKETFTGVLDFSIKQEDFTSFTIDFGKDGLYYDKNYGQNWFNYFWENIKIGTLDKKEEDFPQYKLGAFAIYALYTMSRERGYELIQKYFHVKPHIQEKIDKFYVKHFQNNYIIGIHYRGTDKKTEAISVRYETIASYVNQEIITLVNSGIPQNTIKIFVATDEESFLFYMKHAFPGKIIATDSLRSSNHEPIHMSSDNGYQKWEDALIDCILLSKCSKLYKTASNLSNIAIKYNPLLPVVSLSKEYYAP